MIVAIFSPSSSFKRLTINLIDIPFNETKNEKKHQHIDFRYLLELEEQEAELAELPFFLLELEEAPEEFKKYYRYKNI